MGTGLAIGYVSSQEAPLKRFYSVWCISFCLSVSPFALGEGSSTQSLTLTNSALFGSATGLTGLAGSYFVESVGLAREHKVFYQQYQRSMGAYWFNMGTVARHMEARGERFVPPLHPGAKVAFDLGKGDSLVVSEAVAQKAADVEMFKMIRLMNSLDQKRKFRNRAWLKGGLAILPVVVGGILYLVHQEKVPSENISSSPSGHLSARPEKRGQP